MKSKKARKVYLSLLDDVFYWATIKKPKMKAIKK